LSRSETLHTMKGPSMHNDHSWEARQSPGTRATERNPSRDLGEGKAMKWKISAAIVVLTGWLALGYLMVQSQRRDSSGERKGKM
jgi:hypothetical protein